MYYLITSDKEKSFHKIDQMRNSKYLKLISKQEDQISFASLQFKLNKYKLLQLNNNEPMKEYNTNYNKEEIKKPNINVLNKKNKNAERNLYDEILKNKSMPYVEINQGKKCIFDKQNLKTIEFKMERKKTISPEKKEKKLIKKITNQQQIKQPKASLKNSQRKKKKDVLKILYKTEELKNIQPNIKCRNSNPEIRKLGKSAEYKRYIDRRREWQNEQQLSLSNKKRSLSKQFKKMLYLQTKSRPSSVKNETSKIVNRTSDNPSLLKQLLIDLKTQGVRSRKQSLNESKKVYVPKSKKQKLKLKNNELKRRPVTLNNLTLVNETQNQISLINLKKLKPKKKKKLTQIIGQKQMDRIDSEIMKDSIEQKIISEVNQIQKVLLTEADEFNLNQFRQFQSKASGIFKKTKAKRQTSNEYLNEMAKKIQRCWRRYNTRRLLKRYIQSIQQLYLSEDKQSQINRQRTINQKSIEGFSQNSLNKKKSLQNLEQLQFYSKQIEYKKKITYISNLQEQSINEQQKIQFKDLNEPKPQEVVQKIQEAKQKNYNEVINQIKLEQLKKWNQMITIIEESMKDNKKADTQKLLHKLAQQSEINKKNLESKTQNVLNGKLRSQIAQNMGIKKQPTQWLQDSYKQINEEFHCIQESADNQQQRSLKNQFEYFNNKHYRNLNINENSQKQSSQQIKQQQNFTQLINSDENQKLEKQKQYLKQTKDEVELSISKAKEAIRKTQNQYVNFQKNKIIKQQQESKSYFNKIIRSDQQVQNEKNNDFSVYDEDPLQIIRAADRFKKQLEELNKRTFQEDNQNDLYLFQDDDISQTQNSNESPKLKRETNKPLHRLVITSQEQQIIEMSNNEQSQQEQIFPKFCQLVQLTDKHKVSQQFSQFLLNNIFIEFLRDINRSVRMTINLKNYGIRTSQPKKTVRRVGLQLKKNRGIKTNISAVKQYLNGLIQFILQKKPLVLLNLELPTGPTAKQMLKYMHLYSDQPEQEQETSSMVLTTQVFQDYWKQIEPNMKFQVSYLTQPSKQKGRQDYLKGLTRIHLRSLFDSLNECLDFQRNYGQFGKPFPWKKVPNFFHKTNPVIHKAALQNAYNRQIQMATSFCGIIFDKEQYGGNIPNQQYIKQMHEDRLSRMLAVELIEGQQRWLFYDDQETEILVELSNFAYQYLIEEILNQLTKQNI